MPLRRGAPESSCPGGGVARTSARRWPVDATPAVAALAAVGALAAGLAGACSVDRGGLAPAPEAGLGPEDASAQDLGAGDLGDGGDVPRDLGGEDLEAGDLGAGDLGDGGDVPRDLGGEDVGAGDAATGDGGDVDGGSDAGRPCDPARCPSRACRPSGECGYPLSCNEIRASGETRSGVYILDAADRASTYGAFCEMSADGGGWTLAAKVNGGATTWRFGAALWTDTSLLADESTDESLVEAKLRSFLDVPFSEIRVVFRAGSPAEERARVLPIAAPSLRELFAADAYVPTSLGRASWLGVMPGARLQSNCNREGANVRPAPADNPNRAAVRLGILGNNESDCTSPNSFVGVGARYEGSGWPSAGSFEADIDWLGNDAVLPAFVRIYVR
jgi:hypothetical protein